MVSLVDSYQFGIFGSEILKFIHEVVKDGDLLEWGWSEHLGDYPVPKDWKKMSEANMSRFSEKNLTGLQFSMG